MYPELILTIYMESQIGEEEEGDGIQKKTTLACKEFTHILYSVVVC
jgi:hypothetical protein